MLKLFFEREPLPALSGRADHAAYAVLPVIGQGDGRLRIPVAVIAGGQFPQPLAPDGLVLLADLVLLSHLRGTGPVGLPQHLDPLFFVKSALPLGSLACQPAPSSQASNGPEIARQFKPGVITPDLYPAISGHAKAISVHMALRGLAPRNDALPRC